MHTLDLIENQNMHAQDLENFKDGVQVIGHRRFIGRGMKVIEI